MKKNLLITIHGHVQGVGFRYHCVEMANRYDIKGYVRNRSDGSVFIEAEGEEDRLSHFLSWCHNGPRHARVDNVDTQESTVSGYTNFSIKF